MAEPKPTELDNDPGRAKVDAPPLTPSGEPRVPWQAVLALVLFTALGVAIILLFITR